LELQIDVALTARQGTIDGSPDAGTEPPEIAPIAVATNHDAYHMLRLWRRDGAHTGWKNATPVAVLSRAELPIKPSRVELSGDGLVRRGSIIKSR
jgi:hypothetical protein